MLIFTFYLYVIFPISTCALIFSYFSFFADCELVILAMAQEWHATLLMQLQVNLDDDEKDEQFLVVLQSSKINVHQMHGGSRPRKQLNIASDRVFGDE